LLASGSQAERRASGVDFEGFKIQRFPHGKTLGTFQVELQRSSPARYD
jgi:hypothetical protein